MKSYNFKKKWVELENVTWSRVTQTRKTKTACSYSLEILALHMCVFVPEPVYMNDRKLEKGPGDEGREEVLKGRRKEGTTL